VERSHRTVVTRVHGLKQIEGFRATHLAHDDAFRTHTQTVLYKIAHRDLTLAFKVRRTRLKTYDVRLLELQFRGVLAGDDALGAFDISGETVQKRCLT